MPPASERSTYRVGDGSRRHRRAEPRLLPLADALGILTFATVGLLSHDHALSLTGYARDALPVLGGWFAAALLFGAYRNPSTRTLLLTWIVGVPLGILVRALALGRRPDADQAVFLGDLARVHLLFVLAWRAALGFVVWRRATPDRTDQQHRVETAAAAKATASSAGPSSRARRPPSVDHGEQREPDRRRRAQRRVRRSEGAPTPRRDERHAKPAEQRFRAPSVAKPHQTKTPACRSRARAGTPHSPPSPGARWERGWLGRMSLYDTFRELPLPHRGGRDRRARAADLDPSSRARRPSSTCGPSRTSATSAPRASART